MPNPIFKQVKGDTKSIAQKLAKQLADEPGEILKAAAAQTTGIEQGKSKEDNNEQQNDSKNNDEQKRLDVQKLNNQKARMMQALETELKQIRDTEEQEKLQKQKAEIVKAQQENQQPTEVVQAQGKKRRNILGMFGKKKGPNQPTGTTKAEVRRPPSG